MKHCEACGYDTMPEILVQHHIHGRKNSDKTCTLCPNCHAEVHYWERDWAIAHLFSTGSIRYGKDLAMEIEQEGLTNAKLMGIAKWHKNNVSKYKKTRENTLPLEEVTTDKETSNDENAQNLGN